MNAPMTETKPQKTNGTLNSLVEIPLSVNWERKLSQYFFDAEGVGNAIAEAESIHFLRVNSTFCDITGFTAEELSTMNAWDLTLPEARESDRANWKALLASGETYRKTDMRFLRKDGSVIWVNLATSVIRDEQGKPLYVLGVVQDISKRQQALQDLREERLFLERALFEVTEAEQRLVGHELQEHLCQQLMGAALDAHAIRADIDPADRKSAERLSHLARLLNDSVVQVRDISRGLHPVELDSEGLMSALQELARSTSHTVSCEFICRKDIQVRSTSLALHSYRIAQKAIANSLRHTGATQIIISLFEEGNSIVLQITDNGPREGALTSDSAGMDAKTLHYRARAMGGSIALEFAEGAGTRITTTFPKS